MSVVVALVLLALAGCAMPVDPLSLLPPAEPLPDATTSSLDLGRRLLATDQPQQAEQAFIRSINVEGMTAVALTGAGVAAHQQGLLTAARRYFERAKELDPGSVAAHNNLGATLYGLGDLHSARHAFRTAYALSSGTSAEAERNLRMVDLAIEQADTTDPRRVQDPQEVRRTGSSVYKLIVDSGVAESG